MSSPPTTVSAPAGDDHDDPATPIAPETPQAVITDETPVDRSWLDDAPVGSIVPETADQQIPVEPTPVRPKLPTAEEVLAAVTGEKPMAAPRMALPKVRGPNEVMAESPNLKDLATAEISTPEAVQRFNKTVLERVQIVRDCFKDSDLKIGTDKAFEASITTFLVTANALWVTTGSMPDLTPPPLPPGPDLSGLTPGLAAMGAARHAVEMGANLTHDDQD